MNAGKHDAKKPEHKINIFVNNQKHEVTQDTIDLLRKSPATLRE